MTLTTVEDVGGGEPLAERTLAELGVPPLDILRARTPAWDYIFLELTGDAPGFLAFERADAETVNTFYDRRKQWQKTEKSR